MEDNEIVREFLIESNENLARLDQDFVELEQRPKDAGLLASIFRTIHTIKGTCGFLGFPVLEKVTHVLENLLSKLRNGERELSPEIVTISLEAVDAVRRLLGAIEATGAEGALEYDSLCVRLTAVTDMKAALADASDADAGSAGARGDRGEAGQGRSSAVADSTIRVDVTLLDKLMNLVGELVLARNQILQVNATQDLAVLGATSQRLNLITSELQESVMRTRMQPIGVVWNKFPRLVRDLATQCGKQIRLAMHGSGTELDKTIIEAIKDPLTHIIRNCCDHGLEMAEVRVSRGKSPAGTITMSAFHEGGHVNIEIGDDGGGVDPARVRQTALERGVVRAEQLQHMHERDVVNLVFAPGFSTAKAVTSISGRGVGLDVVKTNIERIGGTVELTSRLLQGTTLSIRIPLTLAIIPGLVVTSGGERFVIPQVSLLELIRREGDAAGFIERIQGTPVYRRRGNLLPLAFLNELLGLESEQGEVTNIIILQAEDKQFGLVVDGISDTQEIVVKPLGKQLKGLSCYAGATIMGDGQVALILDVMGIGQRCGLITESRASDRKEEAVASNGGQRQLLLLFRGGASERMALPLSLVARLEEIPGTKVERAGGRLVVQYRGKILPLVTLADEELRSDSETVQVIVISNGDRSLGIVVDQILDIVDEEIRVRMPARRAGLIGSAVIGGKITDLLDLHAIVSAADPEWFSGTAAGSRAGTLLLADASRFSRALIRSELEMAGYTVLEAATAQEAIQRLSQNGVSALIAATDLPDAAEAVLSAGVHGGHKTAVPLLGLAPSGADLDQAKIIGGFDDCRLRDDREGMLESLSRLLGIEHEAQDEMNGSRRK